MELRSTTSLTHYLALHRIVWYRMSGVPYLITSLTDVELKWKERFIKLRAVRCGLWAVGCEVWGVGCEVWGVGCEVWGVGCEV